MHRPRCATGIVAIALTVVATGGRAEPTLTWTALPLPTQVRSSTVGAVDPTGTYVLGFGGISYVADTWRLSLTSGLLEGIEGIPMPSPRLGHRAVMDPLRSRLLLFGGIQSWGPFDTPVAMDDVWALAWNGDAPAWTRLPAGSPGPSGRGGASLAYDERRDRLIVLGGYAYGTDRNDVWSFDLSGTGGWSPIAAMGAPGAPASIETVVYDAARDRLVVFGSTITHTSEANGVWTLPLDAPVWGSLPTAGPIPKSASGWQAFPDRAGDRVLFLGPDAPDTSGVMWQLSLGDSPTWSRLPTTGAPPLWRDGYLGIWDEPRTRYIVAMGSAPGRDAHLLSLSAMPTWSTVPVTAWAAPPARTRGLAAYLPSLDRMLSVGGAGWREVDCEGRGYPARSYGRDIHLLTLTEDPRWTGIAPPTGFIGDNASVVVDEDARRALVFGGETCFVGCALGHATVYCSPKNTLWQVTFEGPPTWTPLTPVGAPPGRRAGHAAIVDPARDRMVVYGGVDREAAPNLLYHRDTWQLSLTGTPEWSPLTTNGTSPPDGDELVGVHDAARDRMLVFGPGQPVYELSLAGDPTWSIAYPALAPIGSRSGASYVLDPVRDRILVFGGEALSGNTRFGDCYALDLASGVVSGPLPIAGAAPPARGFHVAVFQPSRDRMIVFGGGSAYAGNVRNDTWFLTGDMPTPVAASLLRSEWDGRCVRIEWQIPPGAGAQALDLDRSESDGVWLRVATLRADPGGMVTACDADVRPGRSYDYRLRDGERLLGETRIRIPDAPTSFSFESIAPSPMDREGWIGLSLATPGEARWVVVDLAGRRRFGDSAGVLPAGRHQLPLTGADALAPGVYWVRLTVDGMSRQRSFMIHR